MNLKCNKIFKLCEILAGGMKSSTIGRHKKLNSVLRFYCSSNTNSEIQEEIDVEAITKGNKDLEHKLKVIMLEAEVMRQEGKPVPSSSFLKTEQWTELLNMSTRSSRRKYFEFLFKISKKKENAMAKKLDKRLQWEQQKSNMEPTNAEETLEEFAMKYDLQHNNIFLRIYDTTINNMYNSRLIQALMFGQKLVVDCGYDNDMTKRENLNCAKQLMLLFAENRIHDEPFDLHYCNANRDSSLIKRFHQYIPVMDEPSFPLNIHQCSYLDLFSRNRLVYLTPHCREEMKEFDHDAVYIIGGIVDKVNNQPLSLAKAKKEGLKMAKLPLDRYLQWGSGSGKSLTLNQVAAILLDVKKYGEWNYALRHVPRRKLEDFNMGNSITQSTDSLRFDRPTTGRKWIPLSNIQLGNFSENAKNKNNEGKQLIKNIFND